MKISRLLSILIILLNKKNVTAIQLAEKFEVSVRTIYRDIEMLSAAGIPGYTTQGMNGGISIMENFTLNRSILSDEEQKEIIFALTSFNATEYPDISGILEKLENIFQINVSNWINIDFSPWGSHPNENNKFYDIKNAILKNNVLKINYINAQNKKSVRFIEPLRMEFKHSAWYLYARCRKHNAYRLFRVSRIKDVLITDEIFDPDSYPKEENSNDNKEEQSWNKCERFVFQFKEEALFRLYDEYDEKYIKDNGDGTFNLEIDFPEDDWVYGYILSFGPNIKVIEPEHVKEIISKKSREIFELYQ